MNTLIKRDIIAGIATTLMFLGAFLLTTSAIGYGLIAAGAITWIVLFAMQLKSN